MITSYISNGDPIFSIPFDNYFPLHGILHCIKSSFRVTCKGSENAIRA